MPQDQELQAMNVALQALLAIPPTEWTRALIYLSDRLAARDRAVHISGIVDPPAPTQFVITGDMSITYASAEELVRDNADSFHPMEINGVAIVSQRFAVMVPVGTDDEIEGHEIMWFDTREAADAYVADAMAPAADGA